jgi:hypothetical protein
VTSSILIPFRWIDGTDFGRTREDFPRGDEHCESEGAISGGAEWVHSIGVVPLGGYDEDAPGRRREDHRVTEECPPVSRME